MTHSVDDLARRGAAASVTRRRFIGGAAALASALALGGSKAAFAAPASRAQKLAAGFQAQGNVILIGTLGEAQSINPFLSNESEGDWRCKMLFEEFVRMDPKSYAPTKGPGLAKDWTIEGQTFTFTLNDAKFADGTAVSADDVAFTIMGHLKKDTGSPRLDKFTAIQGAKEYTDGSAQTVSGLEVVDPKTLKVTLATPDASFLTNLRYVFTVPKAQLEGKKLADDPWFQKPVGAGPFAFESWNTGGDFVAKKNANYYQEGKPALDGFIHRVIADSNSLVLALTTNEIDGSIYPSPTAKDQLAQNPDLDLLVPPFNSPNGWMFNCTNEWLSKKEVRQAIAMSINVEQYANDSLLGLGKPGVGPIAPDSWAFDKALKPLPYDPEKAKSLLQQAGFPAGTKIRFMVNQGNVLREDWLVFSQQALKDVGIEVVPEVIEYATLVQRVNTNQDYDACGVDFSGATEDPGVLYDQFHTGSPGNYMKYSNPELDKLLEQARTELDLEKAKGIYQQIQTLIVDEAPTYFAWYRPFIQAVNKKKFTNYTVSNLNEGVFYTLEDWKPV